MYREKGLRIGMAALGILTTAVCAFLIVYRLWERPPELTESVQQPVPAPAATQGLSAEERAMEPTATPSELETLSAEALKTGRQDGVYTILLAGSDDGNGNTDTILVGRIDTKQHRMDFVNIPRDTLINVPWEVRKINAVYWGARNRGDDGIAELKRQVGRLTGFEPDCCAVVELDVVAKAVDALGGVYFDVPAAMDYEDRSQSLSIHLQPGYQLLNGEQALGLCRFRSGYVTGDLGRIEMQQQFLKACADQLITLGNIPNASQLLSILSEGLETDLNGANIAFFLRQLMSCRSEDIHFYTAPNYPETIAGYSYTVLELEPWLEQINSSLNPFDTPIARENLDLVYRSGGRYLGTAALQDGSYYSCGQISAPPQETPAPTPELPTEDFVFPLTEDSSETAEESGKPGSPSIVVVTPRKGDNQ